MLEVLRLVVRILVGWSGVSLIVAGLWIVVATARTGLDKQAFIITAALIVLGAGLLWAALALLM